MSEATDSSPGGSDGQDQRQFLVEGPALSGGPNYSEPIESITSKEFRQSHS